MFRRVRRFWQLYRWLGWELAFQQTEQEILFDSLQELLRRERAAERIGPARRPADSC